VYGQYILSELTSMMMKCLVSKKSVLIIMIGKFILWDFYFG
jgi:hypothetical protein